MNDLQKRLFNYGVRVLKFVRRLPNNPENRNIRDQLGRSGTAPGAIYQEAQGGCSKLEFHHKINLCLRETKESNYWLRVSEAVNGSDKEGGELILESEELMKIVGSISAKTAPPRKLKS